MNLIHPWPRLDGMHLILMRNVLIYLDAETKKSILRRVSDLLDPRGYLVLGGAETTTTLEDSFEPVSIKGAVCFQQRLRPRPI